MDESLTTPHCPVCEEEVTDRKRYFRVKEVEATLTMVEKEASIAETPSTQQEEMTVLGCGHAFPTDSFTTFWDRLTEWRKVYQSLTLVEEHPRGTSLGEQALADRLHEIETLIGRAADACRDKVVSEPKVNTP